jgi:hypothetical protein
MANAITFIRSTKHLRIFSIAYYSPPFQSLLPCSFCLYESGMIEYGFSLFSIAAIIRMETIYDSCEPV